jgi:hypothetical protein
MEFNLLIFFSAAIIFVNVKIDYAAEVKFIRSPFTRRRTNERNECER